MSRQTKYPKVKLSGIEIDALTINEAVDYIVARARNRSLPAGYVVKPYVEFLDRAADDPAIAQILNEAELALPDGVALIWAAAYLYGGGPRDLARFGLTLTQIVFNPTALQQPLPERIAGLNLTLPLLKAAADQGLSVFLIGKESQDEIEGTAAVLQQRLPSLHIAGTRSGRDPSRPYGEVGEGWLQKALEVIQESHADLVLVGMGFPLQERVMARLAPQLDHGLLIGEGGTFDYEQFGGTRRKAPRIMQRSGLEWLWRLILEPRRFKRQLAIPRFIWRVWRTRH